MNDSRIRTGQGRRPPEDRSLPAHLGRGPGELPLVERLVTYLDRLAETGNRIRDIDAAYRENRRHRGEPPGSRVRPSATDRGIAAEPDRYREI